MQKNYLSKKSRLLTFKEFVFVLQKSEKIKISGIELSSRSNGLKYSRIGLSISKKYIKKAHERNRIKRHMRETFRMNQHNLLAKDFILTVYTHEIIYLSNYLLITNLKKLWYYHYL